MESGLNKIDAISLKLEKQMHCSMKSIGASPLTCRPADVVPDKSDKFPKKRERTPTAELASPTRSVNGGIVICSSDITKGSLKRPRNDICSHGSSEPDSSHQDGTRVDRAPVSSSNDRVGVLNAAPGVISPDEWDDVVEVIYSIYEKLERDALK